MLCDMLADSSTGTVSVQLLPFNASPVAFYEMLNSLCLMYVCSQSVLTAHPTLTDGLIDFTCARPTPR